jgi:hypothetical protein
MWLLIANCLVLFMMVVWFIMSRTRHRRQKRAPRPQATKANGDFQGDCREPRARKKFRYSKTWGCY